MHSIAIFSRQCKYRGCGSRIRILEALTRDSKPDAVIYRGYTCPDISSTSAPQFSLTLHTSSFPTEDHNYYDPVGSSSYKRKSRRFGVVVRYDDCIMDFLVLRVLYTLRQASGVSRARRCLYKLSYCELSTWTNHHSTSFSTKRSSSVWISNHRLRA
jgi:hypothetical protein